jgi:ankyrin repeat protein
MKSHPVLNRIFRFARVGALFLGLYGLAAEKPVLAQDWGRDGVWGFLGIDQSGRCPNPLFPQNRAYDVYCNKPRTDPAKAAAMTKELLKTTQPDQKALIMALQAGQSEAAKLLIAAGVNPAARSEYYRYPMLFYALSRSWDDQKFHTIPDPTPDLIAELARRVDVNAPFCIQSWCNSTSTDDHSPFYLACTSGMGVPILQVLLNAGAKYDTTSNALMVETLRQSNRDNPEVVQLLINLGFSPTRRGGEGCKGAETLPLQGECGTSPIDAAVINNSSLKPKSALVLVKAGADPSRLFDPGMDSADDSTVKVGIFDAQGKLLVTQVPVPQDIAWRATWRQMIMAAARANPKEALFSQAFYQVATPDEVRELVDNPSLKEALAKTTTTQVPYPPGTTVAESFTGMVRTRVTKERRQRPSGGDLYIPVFSEAHYLSFFFKRYATTTKLDTPLYYAAEVTPYPEVIDILVKAGGDVRALDSQALSAAVRNPNPKVLEAVLRYKPNPDAPEYSKTGSDAKDENEATVLNRVAWVKEATPEHLRLLLAAKPNLNAKEGIDGNTPLMNALRWKRSDRARMLIEAGADLNVQTRVHARPLDFALDKGLCDLAREMIAAGAQKGEERADGSPEKCPGLWPAAWNVSAPGDP